MSTPASRTPAAKSYRPAGYKMSPGLKRARLPFAVRNGITGGSILVFIAGVYYYSISAVKQDDFADVQDLLPPASARSSIKTIEEELSEKKARGPVVYTPAPVGGEVALPSSSASPSYDSAPSPSSISLDATHSTAGGLSGAHMTNSPSSGSVVPRERPISGVTTAIEREASAFGREAKAIGESILSLGTKPFASPPPASSVLSSIASGRTTPRRSKMEEQMHLFRVPVFSGRTGAWFGTSHGSEGGREVEIDRLGGMGLFVSGKGNEEGGGGRRLV